jgi:hypothetical protein
MQKDKVKIFEAKEPVRLYPTDDFVILEQLDDGNYRALESWAKKMWAEYHIEHQLKHTGKQYIVVNRNFVPIP